MGADHSLFKKCSIDSEVQYKCKTYSLLTAKYDSKKFSIFLFNENTFAFDITHWKTIRHPFIVKYYDFGIFRGRKCVVTEAVEPIRPLLEQLPEEVVVSGVHNIVNSLSFIHSTCGLSVNNLCLDSLFISRSESTQSWKLGSLLCLSSSQTENNDFFAKLLSYHNFFGTTHTLPAEDLQKNCIQLIQNDDHIHRRDAFALSLLMEQLLPDVQLSPTIQCLRSECHSKRPKMVTILSDELFLKSEFVEIKSFLTSFVSFTESEKKQFFSDLVERLRKLSPNLIIGLVSLIVNSRLIMSNSEVHNQLLPYVLIPANDSNEELLCQLTSGETISLKPLFSEKVFKTRIIALICKLYFVRDLRIRSILLQYLPNYALFIPKGSLRQRILPQILIGVKDSNDQLVSLTFKAISHLVTIFGAALVLGPRLKIFSNGFPKLNNLNEGLEVNSQLNSVPNDGSTDGNDDKEYKIAEQNQLNGWTEKSSTSVDKNSDKNEMKYSSNNSLKLSDNKTNSKAKDILIPNDFDIKQLDFKIEDNEIDSLFSDMEPVFKFGNNHVIPQELIASLTTGSNTSDIFAANDDNEENGWTDQSWDNEWEK